jgi:hypothetical protein
LLPSNIAINVLLGVSLQKLWKTINILHFLVYVPSWTLIIPPNVEMVLNFIAYIANGDFIPKEKMINWILKKLRIPLTESNISAKHSEDIKKRFLIIILFCIIILAIIIGVLAIICRRCQTKAAEYALQLKQKLFWNPFIRFGI